MSDLVSDNKTYDDLGDSIEVELKLVDGWLYVESPFERKKINKSELRYDGIPRSIFDFALNQHPNETVTILDLQVAKLSTSRNLQQVAIKAGIKGAVKYYFMPVCDRYRVCLLNKVSLKPTEVKRLMLSI